MSIPALVLTMALETLSPGPRMLACTFPAPDEVSDPISIRVEALPSLKDTAGLYRIRLHLDANGFRGLAGPIDRTDARDVLIRAEAQNRTFYTIGLRDDGRAALNLLRMDAPDADAVRQETRPGQCSHFESYLDTWLTS